MAQKQDACTPNTAGRCLNPASPNPFRSQRSPWMQGAWVKVRVKLAMTMSRSVGVPSFPQSPPVGPLCSTGAHCKAHAEHFQQEVEDLTCVIQHIQTLPAPHNKVLGIVGHSKGAVVSLLAACTPAFAALQPVPLLVNLSGRFDASNLSHNRNRFKPEQYDELDRTGHFVWMHYRAGPEPERAERRPYVVTKAELDRHATRTLAHLEHQLPKGLSVLTLHGKADGTVPYDNSVKMDETIVQSRATSDLMLLEGVGHNWDQPGNAGLLVGLVSSWISSRLSTPLVKQKDVALVDHLGTQRAKS